MTLYCPNCKTTYSITKTIINLHNLPVDEDVKAKFCPVCGWSLEPRIELKEMNIYDKVALLDNPEGILTDEVLTKILNLVKAKLELYK